MIASGKKKEEYRAYKDYWKKRLIIKGTHPPIYKTYDVIEFRNGYAKDAPMIRVKCKYILGTFGKEKWGGDPHNIQFVIKLGKIIK